MTSAAALDLTMPPAGADEAAAFDRAFADLLEDFLLLVLPHLPGGATAKGAAVRAAYRRVTNAHFRRRLGDLRLPLAISRPGSLLALHRAVLDLCRAQGIESLDLIGQLNQVNADRLALPPADALEKLKILLALMFANELIGEVG